MGRHRRSAARTGTRPVRTGLLGASAAMAVGAAAVASGLLPGGDVFTVGDRDSGGQVRADASAEWQTQGDSGAGATPTESASQSPSATPRTPSTTPSATPPRKPSTKPTEQTKAPERTKEKERPATPTRPKQRESDRSATRPAPVPTPSSPSPSAEAAVESEVLALVNEERAKVGCQPLRSDPALAKLAGDFSTDMATRGFFDHTDPDGDSPWDRAEQAGVPKLGGENIARGQADAGAVMNSWMNSDGHRANILNCDYTRLGVGVHMGDGGPWWTQNFGF
ncbi:CAP domain-containing protein [Streptomyces sp. NBC_00690]|uniref:CAP domain-containing protein n=1 Tax=Streptomyces sp. NBC_00690 TaxID=2975808 RepID=UPI002E2BC244|nr:CAP domain-containing protein [Streptomyces sp. NBC_00690]